eukprot:TCONS_00064084-protein
MRMLTRIAFLLAFVGFSMSQQESCCQLGIKSAKSSGKCSDIPTTCTTDIQQVAMFTSCCSSIRLYVDENECNTGVTFAKSGIRCSTGSSLMSKRCCALCNTGLQQRKRSQKCDGDKVAKACCGAKIEVKCADGYEMDSNGKCVEKELKCQAGFKKNANGQCVEIRCQAGYKKNAEGNCEDVNECRTPGLNRCNIGQFCWNKKGNYICAWSCPTTKYDQVKNVFGKTICEHKKKDKDDKKEDKKKEEVKCTKGFRKSNDKCVDIDECLEGSDNCDRKTQDCVNNKEDDPCSSGNNPCTKDQYCYNVFGKAQCIDESCPDDRYYEQRLGQNDKVKECAKTKCNRFRGRENQRCWTTKQFPSSIKRYLYKYDYNLDHDAFQFTYWWNFDQRKYNVDIRLVDATHDTGNTIDARSKFTIEFESNNTELKLYNYYKMKGPSKNHVVMQMDVTSRSDGRLVWRYLYYFYIFIQ